MSPKTVLIAPPGVLPALRVLFGSAADLVEFSDHEALVALEQVLRTRPATVALDRGFAGTARGSALIERLMGDPALAGCQVWVVARHGEPSDPLVRPADSTDRPLDPVGTRRAPRAPLDRADALLEGAPVRFVDVSVRGGQVICPTIVRPNQRVRVVVAVSDRPVVRCRGTVVWSRFELPQGRPPQYRAGIEFPPGCFETVAAEALRQGPPFAR